LPTWWIALIRWNNRTCSVIVLFAAILAVVMGCSAKEQKKAPVRPVLSRATGAVPGAGDPVAGKRGWTMFRGHGRRTGAADVAGPRRGTLLWVFRTGGRIYADAAVTADGATIYVASHDGRLYAVDARGREKWEFETGGKIWTSPAIGEDGTVYVGSDTDALFALSEDGKERWRFVTAQETQNGEPAAEAGRYDVDTSPLLLPDGTVVFGCHLQLIALRPRTGELRWAFTAGQGRAKVFSSPALSPDGTIYFGTQGDWFFALNSRGKVLWSEKTGGDNDSTPVVDVDGNVFMASDDGFVRSFSPNHTERWRVSADAPVRAPLGLSADGTLLVPTSGNAPVVLALDAVTGAEKWRFAVEKGEGDFYGIQSGVTTDKEGYAYFGARDGNIYCVSPEGHPIWQFRTDDQVDAGPVLGPDGTLYVGSDDGRLYAFRDR